MALHRAMFFTLRSRAQNQFAPLFVTLRISRPKLAKRTRCTVRTFFFCHVSCHMNESWTWVVKCKSDTSLSHTLEIFLENSEYERKNTRVVRSFSARGFEFPDDKGSHIADWWSRHTLTVRIVSNARFPGFAIDLFPVCTLGNYCCDLFRQVNFFWEEV